MDIRKSIRDLAIEFKTASAHTSRLSGIARRIKVGSDFSHMVASTVETNLRRGSANARRTIGSLPEATQAALLSSLLGGAGHLRLGQTAKGSLIIVLSVAGLAAYIVPGLVIIALGIYDAWVLGERIETFGQIRAWEFFWHKPVGAMWTVVRTEPLGLSEKFIGSETVRIDNLQGLRPVIRSLRVQKEWQQSYVIEHEKAQTTTHAFEPTVTKSALIKSTVENLYREKYSYSEGKRQVLEENITVEVPPESNIAVELMWKNILDGWMLVIGNERGEEIRVPAYVVRKLSFDQRINRCR